MDSIYTEIMYDFPAKFAATNPSPIKQEIYEKYFNFLNRHEAFKDISKINVYVADTSITKTTQTPDYQFGDLLSDFGGQMGFWVGMSLLSAAELIQLVFDLFGLLRGWRERKMQKDSEQSGNIPVYGGYQQEKHNGYSGYHE